MRRQILCSTGALTRDPDRTDHREIVRRAPSLDVPGFELGLYGGWYERLDDVVADLLGSGVPFRVVHAEKSIGVGLGGEDPGNAEEALERLEANCRAAAALGAETLVLHLWERPDGDVHLDRNLDRLPACLDIAAANGLALAVETIPGDVGTALANVRRAVERDPRCAVTLDTEFLGFHGELAASLAADWLWADGRVRHVHLKDFDGRLRGSDGLRRYLLPGEGTLELQDFLAGLAGRGYGGAITVECSAIDSRGELDERRLDEIVTVIRELGEAS